MATLECWTYAEKDRVDGSTTTLSIDKPTSGNSSGPNPKNVAVGDLLVIICGGDDTGDTAYWDDSTQKPTGFTLIEEGGSSVSDSHAAGFWRVADGTEGSTFSIPDQGDRSLTAWCIVVSGVNTTTPMDVVGTPEIDVTTSFVVDAVTTTEDGCLAITLAAFDENDNTPFTVSGTGWTKRDENTANTAGGGHSMVWASKDVTSAGSTVNCTVSTAAGDGCTGWQFAIAPGAGPVQTVRPSADNANPGAWTDDGGGSTDIYLAIDEETPSDADFIQSPLNPANDDYDATLQAVTVTPSTATISYRYAKNAAAGQQIDLTVSLLDTNGTTVLDSNTHTDISETVTLGSFDTATLTGTGTFFLRFRANAP